MNRRGFLSSLGLAIVGTGVAYSFPNIIVPKNIISLEEAYDGIHYSSSTLTEINRITLKEIYPKLIEDMWFTNSPLLTYLRNTGVDIRFDGAPLVIL